METGGRGDGHRRSGTVDTVEDGCGETCGGGPLVLGEPCNRDADVELVVAAATRGRRVGQQPKSDVTSPIGWSGCQPRDRFPPVVGWTSCGWPRRSRPERGRIFEPLMMVNVPRR